MCSTYEKIISTYLSGFAESDLIHTFNFAILKRHNFVYEYCKLLSWIFSYRFSDRKILLPNFKAVDQTQVEWLPEKQALDVEKLDAGIKFFFANPVTFGHT